MTAGERTDTAQTDEVEAEVSQPGLGELREAVANHLRRLPLRGSLRQDGIAGLNSAVSSVPDGMASGILAGVNPIMAFTPAWSARLRAASSPVLN